MPSFTVRVELHDATDEDYVNLHEFMEVEGFERTITGGKSNIVYKLPPAEYIISGTTLNSSLVIEKAISASSKTKKITRILITESNGWIFSNLEKN